jgi:protoporphyrinogen oxidase
VNWSTTRTGFFVDGHTHSVSNAAEFLRFPLLNPWSKLRLAFTILYCSRLQDWRRLERIPAEDWLIRVSGRATYENLWKPLLLAKLGESYRRVSAVFIWTYVKRMFSARDSSAGSLEQLGYVSGGYRRVLGRLRDVVTAEDGRILTGTTVEKIAPAGDQGVTLQHDRATESFDKLVFTSPVDVLEQVADDRLVSVEGRGAEVEYLGVVCGVLITRKPLTPFYVLNIADRRVPFTGVIGMSNVVATEETSNLHITYLPKYVLSTDPYLRRPDEEVRSEFLSGLRLMFPALEDGDIESLHINRAFKVQPLQVIGYSDLVPHCETRNPDFFVLNTTQFVNGTLNNNEVVRNVSTFMERFGSRFGVRRASAAAGRSQAGPQAAPQTG